MTQRNYRLLRPGDPGYAELCEINDGIERVLLRFRGDPVVEAIFARNEQLSRETLADLAKDEAEAKAQKEAA